MSEIKKIFCRDGETFTIGSMEFIKFPGKDGQTPVVMKDIAFQSRFGDDNDLRNSAVLKRIQKEWLPKIIEAIGSENLCTIKTDLTADGKPIRKLKNQNKRNAQRKFLRMAKLTQAGQIPPEKLQASYGAWKNHISHGDCRGLSADMDKKIKEAMDCQKNGAE